MKTFRGPGVSPAKLRQIDEELTALEQGRDFEFHFTGCVGVLTALSREAIAWGVRNVPKDQHLFDGTQFMLEREEVRPTLDRMLEAGLRGYGPRLQLVIATRGADIAAIVMRQLARREAGCVKLHLVSVVSDRIQNRFS